MSRHRDIPSMYSSVYLVQLRMAPECLGVGFTCLASQPASVSQIMTSSAVFLQGVRVRVTPVWALITPQASAALLELPPQEGPDHATVAAALVALRQPHAQVTNQQPFPAGSHAAVCTGKASRPTCLPPPAPLDTPPPFDTQQHHL